MPDGRNPEQAGHTPKSDKGRHFANPRSARATAARKPIVGGSHPKASKSTSLPAISIRTPFEPSRWPGRLANTDSLRDSSHGIAPTIPQLRQAEVTPLGRYAIQFRVFVGRNPDVSHHRLLRRPVVPGLAASASTLSRLQPAKATDAKRPQANRSTSCSSCVSRRPARAVRRDAAQPSRDRAKAQPVATRRCGCACELRTGRSRRGKSPPGSPVEADHILRSAAPGAEPVASDERNAIQSVRPPRRSRLRPKRRARPIACRSRTCNWSRRRSINDIDRKAEERLRPPCRAIASAGQRCSQTQQRASQRLLAAMDLVCGGKHLRRAGNSGASTRRRVKAI